MCGMKEHSGPTPCTGYDLAEVISQVVHKSGPTMALSRRKPQTKATQVPQRASSRNIKKKMSPFSWDRFLISPNTGRGVVVLLFAILFALLVNVYEGQSVDKHTKDYLQEFCRKYWCHGALVPSRRTQMASRNIPAHQTVLIVPRKEQIWDTDALQDEFIRNELVRPHTTHLGAAAFLAAYLARRIQNVDDEGHSDLKSMYLRLLPKYEDFLQFHPVLWSNEDMESLLGSYSMAYSLVAKFQKELQDEYELLAQTSTQFAQQVSWEQYQTMRLNIMTRSFGTGPVHETNTIAGVDVSRGSHAMVPILDSYDSHPSPHVDYEYRPEKEAFVATSARPIKAGYQVFDSYGKLSESFMFAKFGFINGDGSSITQASLALFHKLNTPNNFFGVLHYLQYDDGYENCISPEQSDAWRLKELKFQHLLRITNETKAWTVYMPPRVEESEPNVDTSTPILSDVPQFELSTLRFNSRRIFSTCRLITLTHTDYDGTATELLESLLDNDDEFSLPVGEESLEFRTNMCIARLATTALARYQRPLSVQTQLARNLTMEGAYGTREWMAAHTIVGEMQALDALKSVAFTGLDRFGDKRGSKDPRFSMRNDACPRSSLEPLLRFVSRP